MYTNKRTVWYSYMIYLVHIPEHLQLFMHVPCTLELKSTFIMREVMIGDREGNHPWGTENLTSYVAEEEPTVTREVSLQKSPLRRETKGKKEDTGHLDSRVAFTQYFICGLCLRPRL